MRGLLTFLSLCSLAAAAPPTPPCAAPPGIVPVLNESLCYSVVVPTNPSGMEIRAYGIPENASLVTGSGSGAYLTGAQSSIARVSVE